MHGKIRKPPTLVAAMVVLALGAAACTSSSSPSTTSTTQQPPSTTSTTEGTTTTTSGLPQRAVGGEVVVAVDDEPPTLNPFLPAGDRAVGALISQAYAAGVYDVDGETLSFVPELVTEIPTVGNGGVVVTPDGKMTVTYQIRPEAVWDDGVPVSGNDFQFTLDTILTEDYPINRQLYQDIDSVVVGEKTFSFTMRSPTIQHELMFSEIIPKHIVEGTDFILDWNDRRWASSGPFVFDEWIEGVSLTLVRNPNYWKTDPVTGQQLPYLDRVTFVFKQDTPEMIASFSEREIDVFSPEPTRANIEELRMLESQGADVSTVPGATWDHLVFQFGPGRLDRNENSCNEYFEMRLAVFQAIDRAALTKHFFNDEVGPIESYITPYAPTLSQDAWMQYGFDPDAAAENYAKAVDLAGKDCSVIFTTNESNEERAELADLFVEMFTAAGIPYENQLEDSWLFFGDTISDGEFDLALWAYQGSAGRSRLIEVHDLFDPASPPPFESVYRWGTADSSVIDDSTVRYSEVVAAMSAEVDEVKLDQLFHEAEGILADNLVIIPLYAHPAAAAIWSDEIAGFVHNPTRAGFTWNIEFWHRVDT